MSHQPDNDQPCTHPNGATLRRPPATLTPSQRGDLAPAIQTLIAIAQRIAAERQKRAA